MRKGRAIEAEYLAIGNSAGGIGAAEAIREVDRKGSIVIISEEPYPAYSRPLISEYLAGERILDRMLFRSPDFYEKNGIELLLGKKAQVLDLAKSIVRLENGEEFKFKKLLLATGGAPIVPKLGGGEKKGVFTFLTLDDARAIADFAGEVRWAVVIGGGLIGISVTQALVKLGIGVTVVEMRDRVLNTILDEEASSIAGDNLKRKGVRIIDNHTVMEITGESAVEGVVLNNGERIECELVVVAIGVVPRTELVQGTGIEVNRGILVDRHMQTSYPDVYACGDVAEAYDFVYGANRVTPIWPNAYVGGRVAGYNMAGGKAEYPGGTAMNSLNYFGLDMATAGMVYPQDAAKCEVLRKRNDGIYQKVILSDDLVVGMVFVGEIDKSGMVYGLMRDRVDVGIFKQKLLADDFGLVYLPKELRQQRLGVTAAKEAPEAKQNSLES
jgi:NAD(P)H-nitrite reductase large subunit